MSQFKPKHFYLKLIAYSCSIACLVAVTTHLQAQTDSSATIKTREYNLFRFQYNPANAVVSDTISIRLADSLLQSRYAANTRLDTIFWHWFPDGIPTQTLKRRDGYQIMIFRGTSSKKARKAQLLFDKHYSSWRSYFVFKAPNYVVKAGDFVDKKTAEKARKKLKKRFSGTSLVPGQISVWHVTYKNGWE